MKILLLRFSSIGDIVLTTPVVRCLKKQLNAEVHFLSKSAFSSILNANPYIDKVFSFPKEPDAGLIAQLRLEHYDLVVDLHHNLRSLRLKYALGRPSKAFHKLNFQKWLLVNLKIDRLPRLHIVDRYMATVQHLGVVYDGEGLDYFIPEHEKVEPALLPRQPFQAFVLGATHFTKRLPEDKIVEICRLLPGPVVLLGGKTEMSVGQRIAGQLGDKVWDLSGKLSLHQSAGVVAAAQTVITHDTGLMHIAAALRKPVVSVWGSTVPEFGMYPFYPTGPDLNTSVEIIGLNCRPCSKIGYGRCPRGHFRCMRDIVPEEVARAAAESALTKG